MLRVLVNHPFFARSYLHDLNPEDSAASPGGQTCKYCSEVVTARTLLSHLLVACEGTELLEHRHRLKERLIGTGRSMWLDVVRRRFI